MTAETAEPIRRDRSSEPVHVTTSASALATLRRQLAHPRQTQSSTAKRTLTGYRYLHTAPDDRTRIVYSEIHRNPQTITTVDPPPTRSERRPLPESPPRGRRHWMAHNDASPDAEIEECVATLYRYKAQTSSAAACAPAPRQPRASGSKRRSATSSATHR